MSTPVFQECQPLRPRWCPIRLEVEVTSSHLRFRTTRTGAWREIPLVEILTVDVRRVPQRSWPVAYRTSLSGAEAYVTLSGQGVRLTLRGGRTLLLGTRHPDALRQALRPKEEPRPEQAGGEGNRPPGEC